MLKKNCHSTLKIKAFSCRNVFCLDSRYFINVKHIKLSLICTYNFSVYLNNNNHILYRNFLRLYYKYISQNSNRQIDWDIVNTKILFAEALNSRRKFLIILWQFALSRICLCIFHVWLWRMFLTLLSIWPTQRQGDSAVEYQTTNARACVRILVPAIAPNSIFP